MISRRQFDARVAEKIFGRKAQVVREIIKFEGGGECIYDRYICDYDYGNLWVDVPPYSSRLDAAMEVVCYMVEQGWQFRLEKRNENWYEAWFRNNVICEIEDGDTIALAICRAALKAVGDGAEI